jgi:hypothetical protein
MGTVTLTTEEYAELLAAASRSRGSMRKTVKRATTRKRGKTAPGMGAALREANKKARKKNGEFRKGYDQKRVMKMAHKIRRAK